MNLTYHNQLILEGVNTLGCRLGFKVVLLVALIFAGSGCMPRHSETLSGDQASAELKDAKVATEVLVAKLPEKLAEIPTLLETGVTTLSSRKIFENSVAKVHIDALSTLNLMLSNSGELVLNVFDSSPAARHGIRVELAVGGVQIRVTRIQYQISTGKMNIETYPSGGPLVASAVNALLNSVIVPKIPKSIRDKAAEFQLSRYAEWRQDIQNMLLSLTDDQRSRDLSTLKNFWLRATLEVPQDIRVVLPDHVLFFREKRPFMVFVDTTGTLNEPQIKEASFMVVDDQAATATNKNFGTLINVVAVAYLKMLHFYHGGKAQFEIGDVLGRNYSVKVKRQGDKWLVDGPPAATGIPAMVEQESILLAPVVDQLWNHYDKVVPGYSLKQMLGV